MFYIVFYRILIDSVQYYYMYILFYYVHCCKAFSFSVENYFFSFYSTGNVT